MTAHFLWSVAFIGLTLLVTTAIEVLVARLFGVKWRALAAVALVNVVTNPPLTLAVFALFDAFGMSPLASPFPVIVLLEVVVVVTEWRLLVWAFQGTVGGWRRLLTLALVANALSATLGTWLTMMTFELLG